jgi:hypothetical protein
MLEEAHKALRLELLGDYLRRLPGSDDLKEDLLRHPPLEADLRDLGISLQVGTMTGCCVQKLCFK